MICIRFQRAGRYEILASRSQRRSELWIRGTDSNGPVPEESNWPTQSRLSGSKHPLRGCCKAE